MSNSHPGQMFFIKFTEWNNLYQLLPVTNVWIKAVSKWAMTCSTLFQEQLTIISYISLENMANLAAEASMYVPVLF